MYETANMYIINGINLSIFVFRFIFLPWVIPEKLIDIINLLDIIVHPWNSKICSMAWWLQEFMKN